MATLEKIRSKSVLLFVIIIVALLAFILGDALTSSRTYFGSGTAVAEAKGKKVDYTLYQQEIERVQNENQNYQNIDADEMSQNVIRGLLAQQLLDQEYEDLGIRVSDSEISEAMTGGMPHPAAQQFIYSLSQQLGFEGLDGKGVLDAIKNPAKYNIPVEVAGQLASAWAQTEKSVEEAMLQQKFYRLVQGLYTANELDAKSVYNDNAETRHVAYVTKGYNTVADADAPVTDDDLKALWEKDKNQYKLGEETRAVDYIIVYIEPSQADRLAGQKAVEDAVIALNSSDGVDAVSADGRFVVNRVSQPGTKITDNALREFLQRAEDGQAELIANNRDNYTIAKRLSASSDVDSINVSVLGLRNAADADSIVNMLNSGAKWADYVQTDNTSGQDSVWVSLVGATGIDSKVKDAWLTGETGKAFAITDSVNGQAVAQIYKVNARRAPVTVYDYASITYAVDPSTETLEKLSTDLRTYLSSNPSSDEFSKNAAEAGYSVLSALVSASSPHVSVIPDSRPAVKWIMEAGKGQISPVIPDNKQTYLLALTVKDIYDDYLPWNAASVRPALEARAIAEKKGAKLVADYQGKANTLEEYAKLMGAEIGEGDVIFVSPRVAGIGFNENAVQGAIASAAQGKVSGPVAGNNSVVVFEVKSVSDESRPYTFDEYAQRFNRTLGIGIVNPFEMLVGDNEIKNYSLNFIQSVN